MTPAPQLDVHLREVQESDLSAFFQQQLDPLANYMAAFVTRDPTDPETFNALWRRILTSDEFFKRTILHDSEVAGHIVAFPRFGLLEVTYWLGREHWAKGVATAALRQFLGLIAQRPLYARVAADHQASIRVLEKCAFRMHSRGKAFSMVRGEKVPELMFILR